MLGEIALDPAGDEHFEQLAAKGFPFEIEAVPRQLLGDRARPLANVAGDGVLERGPDNSQQIVAVVLIKFVILHRDDGVDEIGRELVVGNGFAILDVDLAKDLVVPIDDHAGGFHLLEMREIERGGLLPEADGGGNQGQQTGDENDDDEGEREVEPRAGIPCAVVAGELRRREIINRHAAIGRRPKESRSGAT